MAYNLGDKFEQLAKDKDILGPGAYETIDSLNILPNKVPFLLSKPRDTSNSGKIWTHAMYNTDLPRKIPNCSSMMSKVPRFPYEVRYQDSDTLDSAIRICQCGIQNTCECKDTRNEPEKDSETLCQSQVKRCLFIGPPPRSLIGEGLAVPSKEDRGFKLGADGTKSRILLKVKNDSPSFYNTEVNETTAFYQGCKWSQWTSQRSTKSSFFGPGPADYNIDKVIPESTCAEKLRAYKRKISKQLRFIEMVQIKNILENLPGPAEYSPETPKGNNLLFLGPKAERFKTSKLVKHPSPNSYVIKRDFELAQPPIHACRAKLPSPACFGIKAARFKHSVEKGPGPATYNINFKSCYFKRCLSVPFGSSSMRFKISNLSTDSLSNEESSDSKCAQKPSKSSLSWVFKSQTQRMKPLVKKLNEPSPADLSVKTTITIKKIKLKRSPRLQNAAPFYSSQERFQPWYNWIPIYALENTPGPGYYNTEKVKCLPTVLRGPVFRARRFEFKQPDTPPCTQYKVDGGIETILQTHNKRLKENINKKYKIEWKQPKPKRMLSIPEKECRLINKCISLLNTDVFENNYSSSVVPDCKITRSFKKSTKKSKLLRCFLYRNNIPCYF